MPSRFSFPGHGQVDYGPNEEVFEERGTRGVKRFLGPNLVAIGDSILSAASSYPRKDYYQANSYLNHWSMLSGGRFIQMANRGIGGNTTSQMLTRFQDDVLSLKPDWVLVAGGTNDLTTTGIPRALRNLSTMWDMATDAGAGAIACLIPAKNTQDNDVQRMNYMIRTEAEKRGVPIIDLYTPTVDPASGVWKTGLSDDGVHPNAAGALAIAQYLNTNSSGIFPYTPFLLRSSGGTLNLVTNGTFIGDANADGVADNWTSTGQTTVFTPSLITNDSAITGNWQQLNRTVTTGGGYLVQSITTGYAAGDLLEFACRLDVTSPAASFSGKVGVDINVTGAMEAGIFNITAPISGVVRGRFRVPAGTTSVRPILSTQTAGTGVMKFAQVQIVNLTELGVA